jgi:dTDP-4-dehydrorhamnose 3,5-epimerase
MPESVPIQAHAIGGVRLYSLIPNEDARGSFTECCREQWLDGPRSVQLNLVRSVPGTLRGIHVHVRHSDYLTVVDGVMQVCLGDLRAASPSFGCWDVVRFAAGEPRAVYIPPGVAHGFYFPVATTHLYGMSEYWCPEEEMGCHWADPALDLAWSVPDDPIVSARDARLGSLDALLRQMEPYQSLFR